MQPLTWSRVKPDVRVQGDFQNWQIDPDPGSLLAYDGFTLDPPCAQCGGTRGIKRLDQTLACRRCGRAT